jgi:uncharacterized membrane protein
MTANGINDNSSVVGQFIDAKGIAHGFIYEEESFCQLDYPDSTGTNLLGINNLGQVVGMFTTPTGTFGLFYDRGTFSPPLSYPGAGNLTIANGLNDRGEIVGVFQDATPGEHSFLYKAGRFQAVGYPGAKETGASDINNSGQIVGDFPDPKGTHGFVFLENPGIFGPAVDYPRATVVALRAINNGGVIAGGFMDAQGNEHPFVCMASSLNPVAFPNAVSVSVNGINDRGQIVGDVQYADRRGSFIAALPL